MRTIPAWLIAMFGGVLAAAVAGALGAGAFLALVAAALVGVLTLRVQRDPPWTLHGRSAWRRSAQRAAALARALGGRGRAGRTEASPSVTSPGDEAPFAPPTVPLEAHRTRLDGRVSVRCEVVTPRLQVWHSTQTQRAYEVPRERGLDGALPGMEADLIFERGHPRVVRRRLN